MPIIDFLQCATRNECRSATHIQLYTYVNIYIKLNKILLLLHNKNGVCLLMPHFYSIYITALRKHKHIYAHHICVCMYVYIYFHVVFIV